eukprot:TRINITY_DN16862_c0_g3_i2.p1 TRINITY_DN16862_c0_g3~~TRINITY_DN16862_c0_g3_i2.p1  ORF type:complete len:717 (+),score=248.24 TRINITY_DN16862_c0_g3_i2:75-2225(+)
MLSLRGGMPIFAKCLPEGAQPEGELPTPPSEVLATPHECTAQLLRKHGLQGRVSVDTIGRPKVEVGTGDSLLARFVCSAGRAALAARTHATLCKVDDDSMVIGIDTPEGTYLLALLLRQSGSSPPQFLLQRPESLLGMLTGDMPDWRSDEWRLVDRVLRETFAEESALAPEDAVAMLREKGAKVYCPTDDAGDSGASGWAAVGGYDAAKAALIEHLHLPLAQRSLLAEIQKVTRSQHVPTDKAPGVLLYGPPGTGKTTIARIVAREAGLSMVYLPLESITSKWYGESEERLASVFKLTAALDGAILFLDEIDALGQGRDAGTHEASRRVLSTLLRHMDGLQTSEAITIVGATNRIADLDAALHSRFAAHISLPLPSPADRAAIWALYAKHLCAAEHGRLASQSNGMSGRDIRTACAAAERRWVTHLSSNQLPASAPPSELYAALAKESVEATGRGKVAVAGEGEKATGAAEPQRVAQLERALARAEAEAQGAKAELREVKHRAFPHGAASLPSSRRASPQARAAQERAPASDSEGEELPRGRMYFASVRPASAEGAGHLAAAAPRSESKVEELPSDGEHTTAVRPKQPAAHHTSAERSKQPAAHHAAAERPKQAAVHHAAIGPQMGVFGAQSVARSHLRTAETRPAPCPYEYAEYGPEGVMMTAAANMAGAISENAPRMLEYAASAWIGKTGMELAKAVQAAYEKRASGPGSGDSA